MTAKSKDGTVPSGKAAAERQAKGSVHEAIGKLMGDDAAREQGAAEKRAGAEAAPPSTPRR